MSILGNRVLRTEDGRFLRGAGQYVENLPLDGALTATFVRSPFAHARIAGIDASAAEALPNVQVLTGADVELPPFGPPPFPGLDAAMGRPVIATDTVRFVGEIVAVVVSEGRAAGADAAELVAVDYDPLPAVVSLDDSAKDESLLFPDVGTNVAARGGAPELDPSFFDGCDVVVSGALTSQRMAACPLEPRSAAAEVGADGRLTAWLSTQTPHQDRLVLSGVLRPRPGDRSASSPRTSAAASARRCSASRRSSSSGSRAGSAVRSAGRRRASESMVALNHGRAQELTFTIGSDRDGKVAAYRLEIRADVGAYPGLGAFLPNLTGLMSSGVYAIPAIESTSVAYRHEHDPDRGVPRRRPARGDAGDRAGDGHARRRARPRSRRDPPPELHPEGRVPVHDRLARPVRLRRLRGRARPRAALGRLRRAARRAGAAAASRAARSSSGSGSAPMSRSRTGSTRRSSARSRSRRTAARSSAPARSRTARATRRRSR